MFDFLADKLVRLSQERAALGVAQDAPGDAQVDEGLGGDLRKFFELGLRTEKKGTFLLLLG
jgi:hypothetical protein